MGFRFSVWDQTKQFGEPEALSRVFQDCLQEMGAHAVWYSATKGQEVDFKIVDVRQAAAASGAMSPDEFTEAFNSLLVEHELPDSIQKDTRLLFVGSTGLAKWEKEEKGRRSIKKDIEFIIRTLQSYRLAHYVYVEGLTDENEASSPTREGGALLSKRLIISALLSFARRHMHDQDTNARVTLGALRADVIQSLKTIRKLPEFKHLGKQENASDPNKFRNDLLINEVRLLFQLGKRDRGSPWNARDLIKETKPDRSTFRMDLPDSSYDLGNSLDAQIGAWARDAQFTDDEAYESKDPQLAQRVSAIIYKLRRYELLRDLGRVIGSAALPTLRAERKSKRILIIDDWDYAKQAEVEALRKALDLAGSLKDCVVVPARFIRCDGDPLDSDQYYALFDQEAPFVSLADRSLVKDASPRPETYDVILMDPEAVSDQYGPERLERLANYLKEVSRDREADGRKIAAARAQEVPRIIAYSQRESQGNVQQCLNLGAWAFVNKGRCFRLLFEMSRALKVMKKLHRNETSQASHFRILNSLKPSAISELQRADGTTYIYGGMYLDGASYEAGSGTVQDQREYEWVRELPKADLHCHIGTAISFPTVRLLALNTVGYLLGVRSRPPREGECCELAENGISSTDGSEDLISRVARTVVLSENLIASISGKPALVSPLVALAAAAAGVMDTADLKYAAFGLGDIVIKSLLKSNDRAQEFQVAALLVSALELYRPTKNTNVAAKKYGLPTAVSKYLTRIADRCKQTVSEQRAIPADKRLRFHAESAWKVAMEKTRLQLCQSAGRWDGYYTSETVRRTFDDRNPDPSVFWRNVDCSFRSRTHTAQGTMEAALAKAEEWFADSNGVAAPKKKALDWLRKVGIDPGQLDIDWTRGAQAMKAAEARSFGLEKYVCVDQQPDRDGTQTGLQLYLRGADLLGSAHLQYPDNLLLASYSIARDNVQENIIYSEVRCETTGYTKGGMGAQDATEILLHGFTIATLFLATEYKSTRPEEAAQTWPLARVNLLLAAKRHKTEAEARKVIALLEGYLERRPGDADQASSRREYLTVFPAWWRPADVVGFDISGDESKREDWLEKVLKPLAEWSSPITIHAGEAASAENIWHAVYALNATRIGHGLRLAEDVALLGYCVREGICMEMCPNSNQFTNAFRYMIPNSPQAMLPQHRYPLLDYMSRGLEVTIATDNRYLHPVGRRTLTSEYVTAARLVGGMTQWEVLQIVKAGFKNAFLDKFEISEMIGAIEEKVYGIIAAAP